MRQRFAHGFKILFDDIIFCCVMRRVFFTDCTRKSAFALFSRTAFFVERFQRF